MTDIEKRLIIAGARVEIEKHKTEIYENRLAELIFSYPLFNMEPNQKHLL